MKEGVEGGGKEGKIDVSEYDEWDGYDMDGIDDIE